MVLPRDKRTEYLGGPSFAFSGVITLGVGPSVAVKFHHGAKLDLHNELKSPSRDESLRTCRFKDYPVSLSYRCFTFPLHGFCAWGPSIKERELGASLLMQSFLKAISCPSASFGFIIYLAIFTPTKSSFIPRPNSCLILVILKELILFQIAKVCPFLMLRLAHSRCLLYCHVEGLASLFIFAGKTKSISLTPSFPSPLPPSSLSLLLV